MNRITSLLVAVLSAAALAPATAGAAPAVSGEFPPTGLSAAPRQLTLGPDGNIWVALSTAGRPIAKVEPNGTVTEYASPNVSSPFGIATDLQGNLWVTQSGGVARFTPADPEGARRFAIGAITLPQAITMGPDDNLWTASGENVVQIPPSDPASARTFRVDGMNARGIASGADGFLYIADFGGQLVRLSTAGTVATTYLAAGGLQEVTPGPGTQIGFTQQGVQPNYVGILSNGAVTQAQIPGADPFGIDYAVDQAYWAANSITDSLSRVALDGSVSTPVSFSARSRPKYLAEGPGGTLWVSLEDARRIALVTGLEAPQAPPPSGGGGTPPTNPPVVPPPLPPAGQQPVFTSVSLTRTTTFGRSARLRLSVANAATVTIRLDQKLTGRRNRAGRCVRPSRANRSGRRCTRYVRRDTAEAQVRNGVVSATFASSLGVGSYRVTLSAGNAVGTTTTARALTVKPRPRPRPRRRRSARKRG